MLKCNNFSLIIKKKPKSKYIYVHIKAIHSFSKIWYLWYKKIIEYVAVDYTYWKLWLNLDLKT